MFLGACFSVTVKLTGSVTGVVFALPQPFLKGFWVGSKIILASSCLLSNEPMLMMPWN